MKAFLILEILTTWTVTSVLGHGFLVQPPQRSSAWRFGFGTSINYDDNGLNCGGFANQWRLNDGKCGVCGDPYNVTPKPNEDIGGRYVSGVITGSYRSGSVMKVKVRVTAYHKGWFEFRLCPLSSPSTKVTQACLNQTVLAETSTGLSRFYLERRRGKRTGEFIFNLQLPNYTCDNCVLQWWYNAGNNYGCDNTGCGVGYGKQETFRNCADIRLFSTSHGPDAAINNADTIDTNSDIHVDTEADNIPADSSPVNTKHETHASHNSGTHCACEAVAPYDVVPGMRAWCCMNCPRGYCPISHCQCTLL